MAPTVSPERPAEMNAVICIFEIDKEGFNGVSSIKTVIYYSLGWLWFAATSKWMRDYGRTRSTFQNKQQVSFSNIRHVPTATSPNFTPNVWTKNVKWVPFEPKVAKATYTYMGVF